MPLLLLFLVAFAPLGSAILTLEEESQLENGTFQVLRATPEDEAQLGVLNVLWNNQADLNLDFWKPPKGVGARVDVMVPPSMQATVRSILLHNQIPFDVIIPDVQRLIEQREKSRPPNFNRLFRDDSSRAYYNFRKYASFDVMLDYIEKITRQYPRITKLITVGYSHENRPIKAVKITDPSYGGRSKKAIWVDGGIHAREWAAPHVALYFIHELVTKYKRDDRITHFVRNLDWYIAPMVNPDGYEHTRSATHPDVRLWRKNRSPPSNGCDPRRERCCKGVDLNRNFDFHWGESGSSNNPCSEVYAGSHAFSEPESRAVRDFVHPRSNAIEAFITFHTYSQIWVHAFGHKRGSYPTDVRDLHALGRRAAKEIKRVYGTKYKVGSGADTLYPAAGGSDDWAKDKAGIKFVYLLELRPDEIEWDGFILDEVELLPTCRETFQGVAVVAEEVLERAGKPYHETDTSPSSRLCTSSIVNSLCATSICSSWEQQRFLLRQTLRIDGGTESTGSRVQNR